MPIDLNDYETKLKTSGYIDTRELREERALLLDDAKKLLDKKDCSSMDRERVRQKTEEARNLTRLIDKCEFHTDAERDVALRTFNGGAATGRRFRNQETGEEVRSVRHGESYADAVGEHRPAMSVGRLVYGAATGDWRGAEEEQRTYSQSEAVGGGYLLNSEMSASVIDLARAQSAVSAAGAITVPMATEELKIARVESDPVAYWTHENQEITASGGTFGLINLRSKCLAVYCVASLELIRNAANAQGLIESAIAKAIALKLDESALNGEGANEEPMGLLNCPGVGTYSVGGGLTHDKMLRACRSLWDANVEPTSMIYNSNVRASMALLKDGEGLYLTAPPEIAKLGKYMSTQISSTGSDETMYIGDFSNCIFGIRNKIEIEVSGVADNVFKKKQVAIRGLLWGDFYACRSSDIVRLTGISAST